jgi:hypothetical protein
MQIISETSILMIGEVPATYPFPPSLRGMQIQAAYLAIQNLGACDILIQLGQNSYLAPGADGAQLVAAPTSGVVSGALHQLQPGPFSTITLSQGGPAGFSAVALPLSIIQAQTLATASEGSPTITVASATNIAAGQACDDGGVAIQVGTTVESIAGLTVTLSLPTVAQMNAASVQFSAPADPQPPGLIAVALGI